MRDKLIAGTHKKRHIRKEFWMNGSTFFNGGFLDYLPEAGIA